MLQGRHIYPLQYTIENGTIHGELPDTLPEGVYGFRAVWAYTKDEATHYKGSHVFDLFALTPKKGEVECAHDFMHIKFCSEAHEIPVPEKKPKKKSHGIPPAPLGPVKPCDAPPSCSPLIPSYLLLHGLQGAPGTDATANLLETWGDSTGDGLTQKFLSSEHEKQQAKDATQDAALEGLTEKVSDLEDTDARHDEAIDALAGELDELIAESATVEVTVSPQVFYVGAATRLTARLTSSVSAGTLTLRNEEDDTSLSGSGTELRWDFDYTAAASGSVVVRGVATIRGHERTVRASAYAAWPVYYGTGADVGSAWEDAASARRTPAGTYRMTTAAGDYLWWMVPEDMTIKKVTLSGFDVPMKAAVTVEFLGTTYKVYQSENTYQAGTMEFIVQG